VRQSLGTKLYYSIGEVAELTDLQPYTLRAWEKEFPCLRPRRVRGKNRAYRERDIGIILLIKRLLYEERYSTRGVQQKLKSEPQLVREAAERVAQETTATAAAPAAEAAPPPAAAPAPEQPEPAPAEAASSGSDAGSAQAAPPSEVVREVLTEVRRDLKEVLRNLS